MTYDPEVLMVIGHKNPDTDSICSALAYAQFKRDILGIRATAYRAGNVNAQTQFVLDRFGVPAPDLIASIHPRLADIMIQGPEFLTLEENEPLGRAQDILTTRRFSFVPVVARDGRFLGRVTAIRCAKMVRDLAALESRESIAVDLRAFLESTGARSYGAWEPGEIFEGPLITLPRTSANGSSKRASLALILTGGDAEVRRALRLGATVVVCCGTKTLSKPAQALLKKAGARGLATPQPWLQVLVQLALSMPLREFIEPQDLTFRRHDLVKTAQREIVKTNEGGFVVIDDEGRAVGVVTRLSFLNPMRFRVALVDHNELSQSVEGVEEAELEEILDHHRLGNRSTDTPITFINKTVGSTATILAELYQIHRADPPQAIAGILLGALLSDTLILKSPTTTPLDERMAAWLGSLAGVNPAEFGAQMFAAGCAGEGAAPRDIVRQDLKAYSEGKWTFCVSQMETVSLDTVRPLQPGLLAELKQLREERKLHFSCLLVTDITRGTSLLLCDGERAFTDSIQYPKLDPGVYELEGIVSRKKQLLPYLIDRIRQL